MATPVITARAGEIPLDDAPGSRRIKSPAQAFEVAQILIRANEARNARLASVKGMLDGNPPFPVGKLKANAQAWRSNFNTLEGKAILSSACTPYYDLFSSSATALDVECHYGDPMRRAEWGRIIAEETDRIIKAWDGFDKRIWRMLYNFVGYGRAFLGWDEGGDWRFLMWPHDKVIFPNGVDMDDECLELFIVRSSFRVGELYAKVKDAEAAAKAGWNRAAVFRAIARAVPNEPQRGYFTDHVELQRQFSDADTYWNARCRTVQVDQIYVREHSGRWSRLLIEEYGENGSSGNPGYSSPANTTTTPEFLFKRFEAFDSLNEIMTAFVYEPRDDTWNGATGLGKDIFAPMQAKDRLRMSQLDATFMRGSLILRAITPAALNSIPVTQLGAATIIGPDFEAQQSTMLGDIESATLVNRDLDSMLQSNTGIYRPRMDQPKGNPRTATETELAFMQSTVLGESAVNRFYNQLDRCYQQLFKRLIAGRGKAGADSKRLKDACVERGVPPDIFEKIDTRLVVRAARAIGSGSQFVRRQSVLSLAPLTSLMPEAGRQAWFSDVIASATNQSKVNRYLPQPDTPSSVDAHLRLALLENAAMREGSPVARVATDNDLVHAQVHLTAMSEGAGSLEQGADMGVVYNFLSTAGPHVLQHLRGLGSDEATKDQAQALTAEWKRLAGIADQLGERLQRDAEANAQAQAIEQGIDPEIRLKQAEAEHKAMMAQRKTEAGLQQKQQKLDATLAMQRQAHDQKLILDDAKTAAEIVRKSRQPSGRNGV